MRRWGGLVALVLVVIVAGVCIRLGFWQLDRLEQRRQYNRAVAQAIADPPLRLDAAGVDSLRRNPSSLLFRKAVVSGVFDPGAEVILRGRSDEGRPGVHLVSLLRIEGTGDPILVNRGWVPSPDAATADPRPLRASGVQQLEGILQAMPPAGADASPLLIDLPDTTISTYRRLSDEAFPTPIARELPELYLQEVAGDGAESDIPIPIPLPELTEGSHLGYAVQWFSFAAIAVFGFLITVRLRLRSRLSEPG